MDDHHLVRLGFVEMLKGWPHGTVVVEAGNGQQYAERCLSAGPIDIAIVDLHMPVRDGWETLRWIEQHQKPTKAEIGERLNMRPGTVGTHVKTIYRKLGVSSRVKAVYAAIRAGLIGKDGRWVK